MIIFKRFLLLNEVENSKSSGILKFENFQNSTKGSIRVSNVTFPYDIVVKFNNEIYVGNIVGDSIEFEMEYDLSNYLQAIVIKDGVVVSCGSSLGSNCSYQQLFKYYATKQASERIKTMQEETQPIIVDEEEKDLDIEENPVIVEEIDHEIVEKDNKPSEKKELFYDKIRDKLDELFKIHTKDEELQNKIPNSKWVRVDILDSSFYVVGIIYEDDTPSLICYGVPDKDALNPPENDRKCMQWLEMDETKRGYWMMYQSAIDGKTLTTI